MKGRMLLLRSGCGERIINYELLITNYESGINAVYIRKYLIQNKEHKRLTAKYAKNYSQRTLSLLIWVLN